jgi:hypothetical protein
VTALSYMWNHNVNLNQPIDEADIQGHNARGGLPRREFLQSASR